VKNDSSHLKEHSERKKERGKGRGRAKSKLNYSCNKIAKQKLAKWKVGVKKEASGDFS